MEPEIIKVIKSWTEGEVATCIKVWLLVFASLSYTYYLPKSIPNGGLHRFLTIIPVIILNLILPLSLHSMHLGGSTAFFLVWLANFKLIMLAMGKGPLSDPSISLGRFLALACLPIKIKENPPQKPQNNQNPSPETQNEQNPYHKIPQKGLKSIWNYAVKCLLISLLLRVYEYTDYLHPKLILVLYSFSMYFGLEIVLAVVGCLARALLGVELEAQFDEPYLSTSLQDFWGRRWNLMVSRILRPTIYEPIMGFCSKLIGRKWAALPAILATFLASAIMHELIFFYLGRHWPSGEITCFFLLHGACLVVEMAIKKGLSGYGRISIPRIITGPLTIGFVMVTGFWLFFPEFLRCNSMDRALAEYAAMGAFVKDVVKALTFKSSYNSTNFSDM